MKLLKPRIMKTERIFNLIILDASGSMESIYNQALSGVNETIQSIKKAQEEHAELQQHLTLASFNSGANYLNIKYSETPINETKELSKKDYSPCGCTALYDAMGEMISSLRRKSTPQDRFLVTIITDGYENASEHWNSLQVKSLVEELRKSGWTFTYIGANQDVEAVADSVGIKNTLAFDQTDEGTQKMFDHELSARSNFYYKVCCKMKKGDDDTSDEMLNYFKTE